LNKNLENIQSQLEKIGKVKLALMVEAEIYKRSFYEFFSGCTQALYKQIDWEYPLFYKPICDELQANLERVIKKQVKTKDLIISLPRRTAKSILISQIFCVWCWIKLDTLALMNVCSTQRLAQKSSRYSKLIIESDWFKERFPNIQLSKDNKSKGDYSNIHNGYRVSYGIDSSIIGVGYDVLIIDDPNDPKDNASPISLKNVTDIYQNILTGSQNNRFGLRIIIQQRVSESDLTGFLLKTQPNSFKHICLPAIYSNKVSKGWEYLYDNDDSLLWPTSLSLIELAKKQKELTPQAYASQMLMSPAALEGDIIKRSWFKIIKQLDFNKLNKEKTVLFLDTAFTDNINNDPSAFFVCNVINKKIYVQRAENHWLNFHELLEKIKEFIKLYNISKVYIEEKASGISIIQELKRQLQGRTSINKVNPASKSKIERAYSIQEYLINEKVVLVEDFWNDYFLTQIASFPFSKHDDLVDTLVYAVQTLIASSYTNRQVEKTDEQIVDEALEHAKDFDFYD
jgi:predicted phage terminase large subunit-like protein